MRRLRLCPVYKSDDKLQINNYRPISNLPIFPKIFEMLVYNWLLEFLNKNFVLAQNQYAFLAKHYTFMALMRMVDDISNEINNTNFSIGIFIDLSKAFDTINHKLVIKKLHHYGVTGIALDWFISYLSNRSQFVKIQDSSSDLLNITCGVPQGSILGPLLFILYMNDIINASTLATFILFADDTNIF